MADAGLEKDFTAVLCPTAILIVGHVFYNFGLDGVLVVDTTHHDVVDTGGCFVSCATGHGIVGITLITTEKKHKYCSKQT